MLGVDSGSHVSVIPPDTAREYPVVKDKHVGRSYHTATDQTVKDEGRKSVMGFPLDAEFASGYQDDLMGLHLRVAKVKRGLLAVCEMVDSGHKVVFDKDDSGRDISHIVHKETGRVIPFKREGRNWQLVMKVVPHDKSRVPFGGQGDSL